MLVLGARAAGRGEGRWEIGLENKGDERTVCAFDRDIRSLAVEDQDGFAGLSRVKEQWEQARRQGEERWENDWAQKKRRERD